MPKIYLTAGAKAKIIRETAIYRGEDPDGPTYSADLTADIAEMEKNQGQDLPPGAMPGPAIIRMQACELAHIVEPSGLLIDLHEKIYAPKSGILRPVQ